MQNGKGHADGMIKPSQVGRKLRLGFCEGTSCTWLDLQKAIPCHISRLHGGLPYRGTFVRRGTPAIRVRVASIFVWVGMRFGISLRSEVAVGFSNYVIMSKVELYSAIKKEQVGLLE